MPEVTPGEAPAAGGRLRQAIDNAVVLGDSHGDAPGAAEVLDGALRRHADAASPEERVEALAHGVEIAVRLGDTAAARTLLAEARRAAALLPPGADAAARAAELDDLERAVRTDG